LPRSSRCVAPAPPLAAAAVPNQLQPARPARPRAQAHGGTPQTAAINTATDIVILGDVGPRDAKWEGSKKQLALAAELQLDRDGSRKKPLDTIHFGAGLAGLQEVRDSSVTCEFKVGTKSYKKPGEERTRGQVSGRTCA